ncbi:membrane protein [Streptomyces sp. CT34]|uniref:membrane protein n=1 Tax=Streptomyces sp. CT34 TaxID=1553907 RepID=UPI0005BBC6D0|nr:membrane protein [Streptomyces sp. CT34]
MSDNQPQHPEQYPYDPYAHPSPPPLRGDTPRYAPPSPDNRPPTTPLRGDNSRYAPQPPHPGYDPQRIYGDPYGHQPYDAYVQQPPRHQPQQPYGYGGPDPYAQPHQAPYVPDPYATQVPPQHQTTVTAAMTPAGPAQTGPAPAATTARDAPVTTAPLKPHQIARAEGRSPIIPPGIQPAALTALLALLIAVAAPVARPALLVPVVLLQAVTAAGWFRLNGMWPARQGIALAFLGGVTTDVALLATPREDAPLVALGTLGVWCLLVLVLQLRNRSSADERMYALTAGLTSSALVVLASGQLAADPDAVVVGAAAVALAALARAVPLPSVLSLVIALLAAAGAGIAAGQLTGLGPSGAVLGLAAGGCALIGLRVASYDYPSRFVHMTAGVALPLALAAPAVYVLGRALG